MKRFSRLYHHLDQSANPEERTHAWLRFLESSEDSDKLWMIALYCGKGPSRLVTQAQIFEWALELCEFSPWMIEASLGVVGDKHEGIALLLPRPSSQEDIPLFVWMEKILQLKGESAAKKKAFLQEAWEHLEGTERWVLHKLLSGGFRPLSSFKQLVKALALHTGWDSSRIFQRLQDSWDPSITSWDELITFDKNEEQISRPFPFAMPREIGDVDAIVSDEPSSWLTSWDKDGIRVQVIFREGKMFIWNHEEELITTKVPELNPLAITIPTGTVLDGLLIAVKNEKALPLSLLQARLGRKNVTKKALKDCPILFYAFDMLEEKGEDLRTFPFTLRREKLEKLIGELDLPDILMTAELMEFDAWDQVKELRPFARDAQAQGLLLMRKDSPYSGGEGKGQWLSWKSDPLSILAVMIYAQRGAGGRQYTSFTFAVRKENELIPFAKADKGLSEEEIDEINEWVRGHTEERFGPVRSVQARLVFELGFDAIEHSKRRKSGMVLRNPRILKWHRELQLEDIGSMHDLTNILERFGN